MLNYKLRTWCLAVAVGLLGFGAQFTLANMELSNVVVHFEAGDPARQDVEVFNTGDQPMYVDITAHLVLSPGTAQEDRTVITDPREAGLLVTPNKMIVPPGASKVVRLVKIGNFMDERIYRIAAKPVTAGVEAQQSGLKILIGYEILAIVYPSNTKPNLQVERHGRQLVMHNTGNANVLVREGYQCEKPKQPVEDCTPLPGRRMYPGNHWVQELPHDLPVTYYQSVGTRNFVEVYQ